MLLNSRPLPTVDLQATADPREPPSSDRRIIPHLYRCTSADIHLVAINESERIVTLTGHGAWWAGAVDDFKDYQG